jgi:hypothetical protein
MTEPGSDLRFDRATYASGSGATAPCTVCKKPLGDRYWKWQQHIVCDACRNGLAATLESSQSASSFGKALLQGGLVALGCGVAYAIFVGVTKIQLAIATIGIAFVIAKVVRKASRGVSGRRFQVLAVALTYVASAMGYAPGIFKALGDTSEQHASPAASVAAPTGGAVPTTAADSASAVAPTTSGPGQATTGNNDAAQKPMGALGLVLGIVLILALILAAPFLELTDAPIGFLIVLFGLWEAWKLSRGVPVALEGPFQVGPTAGPPGT